MTLNKICILFILFSTNSVFADTPVFMSIESRFASGELPLEKLQSTKLDSKSQDWTHVEWQNKNQIKTGWVLKRHLIEMKDQNQWSITKPEQLAIRTQPQLNADIIEILPKNTPVRNLESFIVKWNLSWSKEHGNMWWNNTEDLPEPISTTPVNILTEKDIFKREIFDMASSPLDNNIKVVSATGIFITTDGKSWRQIPRFENENLPVIFSNTGALFVGAFKSEDAGQNFAPSMKWDNISAKIINFTGKSPHTIRLISYEPHPENSDYLLMQLQISKKNRIKLYSVNEGVSWEVYHKPLTFSLLRDPVTYSDLQR